ncbi:MAG TPA: efflux RND transporter periplasmic adaptor subunit [Gemmatimonadaceae bacterium]|nr:efflux RND transporter periplasmic adaptor subunit [Gemmatimonadaceae bacterium]
MRFIRLIALGALLVVSIDCSGSDNAGVPDAQARPTAQQAGGPGSGGGGQGGPGRASPTITLATSDVAPTRRDTIEEGIPITGDLRPIESVDVRARLEGDLVAVNVREGERVKAGQVLARFEASEQESGHASARADQTAAESEASTAQWNLEQTTELFRAGAVSERDHKMAEQAVTAAKAKLAAAQARVRATQSLLTDTRVIAPTSGVIAQKMVENGEHLARGAELFTLVRSDVLELAAAVPARQANAVRVGQVVHFSADGRSFDGKVARVSPTLDPATRSVGIYIQVPNESGSLKGGTFASGRVVSRVVPGALVVPTAAIRQSADEGKPYVYRLAGKSIDIASVQLGVVDDRAGMAEVLDGLSEGDRVIVGNVGVLGRGMQVIIAGEERQGQRAGNANGSSGAARR